MPDFKLPDLGEGVTEAEVERWLVEEGQTIAEDAPLVEVITDKATAEIPSPFAGVVNKIHVREGDIVPVGTVLVTIGEESTSSADTQQPAAEGTDPRDAPATTDPAPLTNETTTSAATAPVAADEPVSATEPNTSPVADVPATGLGEVPAVAPPQDPDTGREETASGIKATPTIRKLARDLGVEISAVPGTGPGGRITREDVEQAASIADRFRALRTSPPAQRTPPQETPAPTYVPPPADPETGPPPMSPPAPVPYARPVEAYPPVQPHASPTEPQAASLDPGRPAIDIPPPAEVPPPADVPPPAEVPPPADVPPPAEVPPPPAEMPPSADVPPTPQAPASVEPLDVPPAAAGDAAPSAPEEPPSQPEAPSPTVSAPTDPTDRRVPLRGIRRTIAERLAHSHQVIPPVTHVEECDLTALDETRRAANDKGASPRLSFLPFIVKAVAATLPQYPALNASLDDDAGEIVYHGRYDIGVAVDTPNGLVVPVVRAADEKGLTDVAQEIETLAAGARDGTLMMEQLRGSTFTVTSPGAFGGLMATPIVLHPQTGILGVHRASERPVVREGQVVIRLMVNLSITFDHRVLDGVMAAKFLLDVIKLLEDPGVASLGGSGI